MRYIFPIEYQKRFTLLGLFQHEKCFEGQCIFFTLLKLNLLQIITAEG